MLYGDADNRTIMQRKTAVDYASGLLLFDTMNCVRRIVEGEVADIVKRTKLLKNADYIDRFLKVCVVSALEYTKPCCVVCV